mmetsp:Transcript_21019/g.58285  ORF Transcript_21019/g.58285 Transcript_21019/m.58285 type:complete len:351 (+) Transcript_21019:958-2010(+)
MKLHKTAEKIGKKLEKKQEKWFPGKEIQKISGTYEGKMQELQKEFEQMKMKEDQKQADLAKAQVDLKSSTAALQQLRDKVQQLNLCRQAEAALVENLFASGELKDAGEQQLQSKYHAIGPQMQEVTTQANIALSAVSSAGMWANRKLFGNFGSLPPMTHEAGLQVREFQNCYGQAEELLINASHQLDQGMQSLMRARRAGGMDQAGNFLNPGPQRMVGGNMMLEMMKKRGVSEAEEMCNHAKANVIRAKQILPAIPYIELKNIQQLNFALGIVFDNVVSDAIANRKIEANMQTVQAFKAEVLQAQRWVNSWLNGRIKSDAARLDQEARAAKQALDSYRRNLLASELAKSG